MRGTERLSSTYRALLASLAPIAAGFLLMAINLATAYPGLDWLQLVALARQGDLPAVIALYTALPRIVMAILCGIALGVSGTVFQQVLRNPLVEPATLGVSAGAYLALAIAATIVPGALTIGKLPLAVIGAACSIGLVLLIAWHQRLSPVAVSLAGLTLNLVMGSLASIIITFHRDGAIGLSFWSFGTFRQNDWMSVRILAWALAPAMIALVATIRPTVLFNLHDDAMSNLGVSVRTLRLIMLGLATWIAGAVVACAGIIGFVGLAAPWLARLFGARQAASRLVAAGVTGAALLLITDQALVWLGGRVQSMPVGAMTAFLSAPLMLYLLRYPISQGSIEAAINAEQQLARRPLPQLIAVMVVGLLAPAALVIGMNAHGWHLLTLDEVSRVLPWRWPRILGAGASGAALAVAGTVLQRLTANPMASPEVLGVSAGAVLGALAAMFCLPVLSIANQMIGAALGAAAVLALIIAWGWRSGFDSDRLLLAGIGLGTALDAVSSLLMLLPDPRFQILQVWLVGSTDQITPVAALAAVAVMVTILLFVLPAHRWLTILPLGSHLAFSLGVNLRQARLSLLLLIAVPSAVSAVIIGPLSFVGLMGPHLAYRLGARRTGNHLIMAALLGGGIMVLADWAGRTLAFPYEIPAGLLASLVGGPYFFWSMRRR